MRNKIIIFGFTLCSGLINAQVPCVDLKTPNDLLKCVLQNHANVKVGKSLVKEARWDSVIAEEHPNPELQVEIDKPISPGFGTSLLYMHTFELGGKKKARKGIASSQVALSETFLTNQKDKIILDTVLSLYRMRQIDHELEINKEIDETFQGVISSYKNAGNLGPEKETSISVFNLALRENLLNKNSLLSERLGYETRIQTAIGKKINISKSLLPKDIENWPNIDLPLHSKGNEIKLAEKNLALSHSRFLLEKSEATPNISLGLKVDFTREETNSFSFGLVFSMPLPIYNQNSGSIAKAMSQIQTNEIRLGSIKDNLNRRKAYLQKIYADTQTVLSERESNKKINFDHKNLHKMIERGVISPSTVIELHRQTLEFYNKLHQQELVGINALWQIYAINGTVQSKELR